MRCEIPHRCVRRKYRIRRHSPFRLRNCWEGRSVRASSLLRQLAKGGCAARRLSWVTPGFSQSRRCKTTASAKLACLQALEDPPSEDQRAIETFQQRVISGNLLGFHCPAICHFIERTVEKEGGSYKCHHCDKGKAIVQDASTDSGPKDGPPPTRNIVEKEDVPTTSSKQVD